MKVRKKHLSVALSLPLLLSSLGGSLASAAILPATVTPPSPPSTGYFVDSYKQNVSANVYENNNSVLGLLSGYDQLWAPGDQWYNGQQLHADVLNANIQKVVDMDASRTSAEADAAYYDDRRNQSYSVMDGLGSLTDVYRTMSGATTTINNIPADATTKQYNDAGNDAGDPNSSLGNIVKLVQTLRGNYSSTSPAKKYFKYPRPYRWSGSIVDPNNPAINKSILVPTLVPEINSNPANDGGFPSGHTNAAYLSAIAMAYAVPERFQELLTRASELGNNRIFAGMHSPLDVMGGRVTATALAAAILSDPSNSSLKQAAYDDAHSKLLTQTGTAEDRFSNYDKNKDDNTQRLTSGFSPINATTNPMVVPKGAEVLLETRLPYLDSTQRRWVLATTGLSSGYPLLDDQEGWGRLNLFAAADGYGAFATDVTVTMDSNKGGFNALDRWRNDISGPGKLTKEGTGTLKLQGSNAYSGGTQVDEGALEGNSESAFGSGDVTVNGGTLVDNVPGPMIIGGNYTQSAGGTLELDLSSKNDHLEMNGAVQANGKLRLNFLNNYVPADGVYTIISHGKGQRSGQFASVETVGLPSQYKVNIIYNADSIQLAVGYTGISLDSSNYDLSIGSSHNTVVSATYSDGTVVDVSQYATYSSSQPQIATVSSSGLVTAISSGTTVITATYENYSATSTIQAYKSSSGGSSTGENTSLPTPSPAAPQTTAKPDAPKAPIGTTAPSSSKIFSDVNEAYSWAAGAIDALASKGIIQGTSDKTFSPDKKITRADVVVLLVRALNLKADFTSNFSDVNKGDYYYEYLGIAKQLGLVNGMEDNAFNPKEDITREDLMLLCSRALKLAGKDVQGSAADLSKFADSAQIAPYAAEGVASLVKQGIVEGNGNGINPLGTATRAETAVIIYRMLNMK